MRFNPHARSHTLLFCTLIYSSWFRAFRQRENLEADRVQPVSTLPKPPTGTAEERVMCVSQPSVGQDEERSGVVEAECLFGNHDQRSGVCGAYVPADIARDGPSRECLTRVVDVVGDQQNLTEPGLQFDQGVEAESKRTPRRSLSSRFPNGLDSPR